MDCFLQLLLAMGCNSMFFDQWSPNFDVIGALPLEVAIIILRKLDGKSLLNAAQVSTRWLRIIKFDRVLRNTVRAELARQRQEKLKRHMFLSESYDNDRHSEAFQYHQSKKPRRHFEKSVSVSNVPKKRKTTKMQSVSTTLRKLSEDSLDPLDILVLSTDTLFVHYSLNYATEYIALKNFGIVG